MDTGFRVEVMWNDVDVFKVRVAGWNGAFGGLADAYVPIGGLTEAAAKLDGFPCQPSDTREVEFGAFGPERAGGAVNMRFWCKDAACHAVVEVRIESDYGGTDKAQSVLLIASVEAAAIDNFVIDLRRVEAEQQGVAFLRASSPS
jgi:hypothetical protein